MYNISILDRMGLLLELCNDCVGAVSVFKVKKRSVYVVIKN